MSKIIKMSEEEFRNNVEDNMGICLACGETRDCCEPDARGYECESCGSHKVYGTEELLLMGRIQIIDSEEE